MVSRMLAAAMGLWAACAFHAEAAEPFRLAVTCHAQDQMVCDIKHDNCMRACADPAACAKTCCDALENCRKFSACPERTPGCST